MDQDEPSRRPRELCLLSLDGGGVRGLSSLYILKHLMDSINPESPPKPCNYFDMIGGTSTGGLIAIMLGRLEMDVDECIEVYREISPKIFTKLHHRMDIRGKVQGRFDHTAIEEAVKDILRRKGLSENELLRDKSVATCKTFVCATSKQTGKTVVLSSYVSKRRGRDLVDVATIWQATRATSAATSFFDPIRIADEDFVDGATPANNPIMELWTEAYDCFGSDDVPWDLEKNVACVVSIGTGLPILRPFGDDLLKIGAKLVKIATDTETRAEDFIRHHPRLSSREQYYRFNVSRGLESVGLEEASKLNDIISATRHYLQTDATHQTIMKCADKIGLQQELARNYATASSYFNSKDLQAYLENTKMLGKLFDISPSAEVLAWFTNTKNYKHWVQSDGGYLYYPTSARTADGHGRYLIGAIPASWRKYPPRHSSIPVRVAYVDCSQFASCSIRELLRNIVSQVMLLCFPSSEHWLQASAEAKTMERRLLGHPLEKTNVATLYNILSFILASSRSISQFSLLLVVNNIDRLRVQKAMIELAQWRIEMERMRIHVLVTGKSLLADTGEEWGSQTMAKVDEDTEYLECLEALKFDDLYTRRNQVSTALRGTNEWYRSHASFLAWKRDPSGLLWIQGKPGAGKSVLAKSILIEETASPEGLPVVASWFYSKRGGTIGMSHDSMMRSIIYQLLEQCQDFFSSFRGPYFEHGLVEDSFADMLGAASTRDDCPRIVCVLDGLDESEGRDDYRGRGVLDLFAELTELPGSRLKVIILSRPYRTIELAYGTYDILLEAENSKDIKKIIDQGIDALAEFMLNGETEPISSFGRRRRLLLERDEQEQAERKLNVHIAQKRQEEEMNTIRSFLVDNARGVTLWVTMSIGQINRYARKGPSTWMTLRKLLTKLPLELDEMYRAITQELVKECTAEHIQLARTILAWVITASTKRPLLVKELLDAMSIPSLEDLAELRGFQLQDDPIQRNRPIFTSWPDLCRSISDICGLLIEFVNPSDGGAFQYKRLNKVTGNSVVQLVHQTAKDYLEGFPDKSFGFEPQEAHSMVTMQSDLYLRIVLPLDPAAYTPCLNDISDNWMSTVSDTVHYFKNKHLLPFILTYFPPGEELRGLVASSDAKDWWLAPFFQRMFYRDLDVDGVVEDTVIGRCFSLACNLGLQTAVDSFLYLTSLLPGWWVVHREVVLGAAMLSAKCYELTHVEQTLAANRRPFSKPALQLFHSEERPGSLTRALQFGGVAGHHYRLVYGSYGSGHRPVRFEAASTLPRTSNKDEAKEAIFRILHYLLGNAQPLSSTKEIEGQLATISRSIPVIHPYSGVFTAEADSTELTIGFNKWYNMYSDDSCDDADDCDDDNGESTCHGSIYRSDTAVGTARVTDTDVELEEEADEWITL